MGADSQLGKTPKQWARALVDGTGVIISQDGGVVSCTRTGAGVYAIVLRNPLGAAECSPRAFYVDAAPAGLRSPVFDVSQAAAATPTITVRWFNNANALTDTGFSFAIDKW